MRKSEPKRILIIEDEVHIAEGLELNLSLQGYEVKVALDGVAGLQDWQAWHPDLVILDIMLPGIDGLSVLQNIRLEDEQLPILILSAKGTADDKIKGFTYGVDDYLTKPFNLEEFLLRVDRLLKRTSWNSAANGEVGGEATDGIKTYAFGDNQIDFESSTAVCRGKRFTLTAQEIKLLKLFINNRGKPLTRNKLLKIGWGYTGGMTTRTVDNFMVRLRKYFEDNPRKPVYFKSLRSVGYVFDNHPTEGSQ